MLAGISVVVSLPWALWGMFASVFSGGRGINWLSATFEVSSYCFTSTFKPLNLAPLTCKPASSLRWNGYVTTIVVCNRHGVASKMQLAASWLGQEARWDCNIAVDLKVPLAAVERK